MPGDSPLQTALHAWHGQNGGRLVEFAGWSMPIQYTTIVEEHRAVRTGVGLFDISHMGRLTFDGPGALDWLERVTTNHVARLATDEIQYSLLANDDGGVIDDVLVYGSPFGYTLVCNASNRERVVAQFERHRAGIDAKLIDRTLDTAMIAVQGPAALATLQPLFSVPAGVDEVLPLRHGTGARRRGGRQPDRVHRRGRLRADGLRRPCRGGLDGLARRGARLRDPALRPGRPGHAPVRGGHAPVRPRALRDDQPLRGEGRLGRQARQGRVRRPRGPPPSQTSARARPGRPPPGREADRPPGERGPARRARRRDRDLRHLLSDAGDEPGHGARRARTSPRSARG